MEYSIAACSLGFRGLELEPAVGTEDRLAQRRLIGGATA